MPKHKDIFLTLIVGNIIKNIIYFKFKDKVLFIIKLEKW